MLTFSESPPSSRNQDHHSRTESEETTRLISELDGFQPSGSPTADVQQLFNINNTPAQIPGDERACLRYLVVQRNTYQKSFAHVPSEFDSRKIVDHNIAAIERLLAHYGVTAKDQDEFDDMEVRKPGTTWDKIKVALESFQPTSDVRADTESFLRITAKKNESHLTPAGISDLQGLGVNKRALEKLQNGENAKELLQEVKSANLRAIAGGIQSHHLAETRFWIEVTAALENRVIDKILTAAASN